MKNLISKYANGKSIFVLAILFGAFNLFVFPNVLPVDQEPLDLQFYYNADQAYALISSYDEDLRQSYMIAEMTLDVIYPVIYSTLFSFILFLLLKNPQIAKVPFLIFVADLLENTGIVLMLKNYPERLETLATITGIFTSLKWGLIVVTVLLILYGIIGRIRIRNAKI